MRKNRRQYQLAILIIAPFILLSCQPAYYYTMEKFGFHKRDLLVDGVEKARNSQEEAKEQFKSALERFSSVVNFDGGTLQEKYEQLNAELELSESRANTVHDRITEVENVADALFIEWEEELNKFSNDKMRQISQRKLFDTQQQYTKLISAMKNAEEKIEPVLVTFRDQVLFLKHNLNAEAIASLKGELMSVESDVSVLINEMEKSIEEANKFIMANNEGS